MSALAQPLPRCPCGLTISFEKSDVFFAKKVRTSVSEEPLPLVRTGQTPLTADVFYGKPLTYYAKSDGDGHNSPHY